MNRGNILSQLILDGAELARVCIILKAVTGASSPEIEADPLHNAKSIHAGKTVE